MKTASPEALDKKTHAFMEKQYSCLYRSILPVLKKQAEIEFRTPEKLTHEQRAFTDEYFHRVLFPVLTPLAVDSLYFSEDELNIVELATSSFGQNFSITPIQMITAIAAVANGGYLVQPHVVDRMLDSDGNIVKTTDTSYKRQVISEDVSICVTVGQEVKQGEVIGYVGTTGNSTGNHLHFEVWQNGERTDALGFFKVKE